MLKQKISSKATFNPLKNRFKPHLFDDSFSRWILIFGMTFSLVGTSVVVENLNANG